MRMSESEGSMRGLPNLECAVQLSVIRFIFCVACVYMVLPSRHVFNNFLGFPVILHRKGTPSNIYAWLGSAGSRNWAFSCVPSPAQIEYKRSCFTYGLPCFVYSGTVLCCLFSDLTPCA